MLIVSCLLIYLSGPILAEIVITLYLDRESRKTKTASYCNRAHRNVMNVLERIQMYGSACIRWSQIGSPDHDNPVLDRDIPYSDVCDRI